MNLFSIQSRGRETAPDADDFRPADVPEDAVHDLDVRPALARGEEPLAAILEHAGRVPAGHVLRLRAPFEPVPLYAVLAERGFAAWTERLGPDDWRVWFRRAGRAPSDASAERDARCGGAFRERVSRETAASGAPRPSRPVREDGAAQGPYLLDVRLLDGPAKHATIHQRFDALGPGQTLTIVNDHDPKPLYYELCAERADRFDAAAYRAYPAGERVWVAVLPVLPD